MIGLATKTGMTESNIVAKAMSETRIAATEVQLRGDVLNWTLQSNEQKSEKLTSNLKGYGKFAAKMTHKAAKAAVTIDQARFNGQLQKAEAQAEFMFSSGTGEMEAEKIKEQADDHQTRRSLITLKQKLRRLAEMERFGIRGGTAQIKDVYRTLKNMAKDLDKLTLAATKTIAAFPRGRQVIATAAFAEPRNPITKKGD